MVDQPIRRQPRTGAADAKFQVRLPADLLAASKAKATAEGRTLSAVVVELLAAYTED